MEMELVGLVAHFFSVTCMELHLFSPLISSYCRLHPIANAFVHANVIHFVDLFAGLTCPDLMISFLPGSFYTNLLKYKFDCTIVGDI
jgi:hypothetical protein